MKYILFFLLACLPLHAADWALPAANQGAWLPGTNVGVTGGVDQYRVGGASARTTLVDVTASPYLAAKSLVETTGGITAAGTTLTVASAASFAAGNHINYGMWEIQTLTITGGASSTTNLLIKIDLGTNVQDLLVPVVSGDTATQVATKIRAATVAFGRVTTGGSGTAVTLTYPNAAVISNGYIYDIYGSGVTGTMAKTQAGTIEYNRISSVSGNVLTLANAASASLTGALVQHNDAPAIMAALKATPTGQVTYMPAGTYRFASTVEVDRFDSGKTIRGEAGTIVYGSLGQSMFSLAGGGAIYGNDLQTVTGTKTKGTSSLQVTDASLYPVDSIGTCFVENEENNTRILAGAAPTWSNSGFRDLRAVAFRVTASNSTTDVVTIDPPLPWDCTAYAVRLEHGPLPWVMTRIGFEDFAVSYDAVNHPPFLISMASAVECWAYNISCPEWKKATSSGSVIFISGSHRSEVRRCDFRTLAPTTYSDDGAIQLASCSSLLIEDNISTGFDSAYYNSGATYNCAILYNYFPGEQGNYPGHNGHNSLDLIEGNVTNNFHLDAYHGSGSHMTFYRNWMTRGLFIKRFMYYMAVAGNVFGQNGVGDEGNAYGFPNIGNSDYVGTTNHFTGDPHADWKITGTLTTRTSDTAGVVTVVGGDLASAPNALVSLRWNSFANTRVQMDLISRSGQALTVSGGNTNILPAEGTVFDGVWLFAAGYQEFDQGVEYTMTRADNYHSTLVGTGAIENGTADVLPASLAYAAKPAWFGALAWPPVNPDAPTFSVEIIPAGYRYINDAAPPAPSGPTVTTGTLSISGALSIGN